MEDQDAEKQRRVEAVAGMKDMLEASVMAASVNPKLVPLYKELTLFALRTFKPARSMEQAVEDAFDELMRNPPPPPQDPNAPAGGADAAAAAMAEVQRKTQRDQAEMQLKELISQAQAMVMKGKSDESAAKVQETNAKAQKTMTEAEVAKATADTQSVQREQDRQDALARAKIKESGAKIDESAAKADAIRTKSEVDTKVAGAKVQIAAHETQAKVGLQHAQAQTDQGIALHGAKVNTTLDAVEAQARISAALMKANPNSPFNKAKNKATNG